jgi:hypothetical protein
MKIRYKPGVQAAEFPAHRWSSPLIFLRWVFGNLRTGLRLGFKTEVEPSGLNGSEPGSLRFSRLPEHANLNGADLISYISLTLRDFLGFLPERPNADFCPHCTLSELCNPVLQGADA